MPEYRPIDRHIRARRLVRRLQAALRARHAQGTRIGRRPTLRRRRVGTVGPRRSPCRDAAPARHAQPPAPTAGPASRKPGTPLSERPRRDRRAPTRLLDRRRSCPARARPTKWSSPLRRRRSATFADSCRPTSSTISTRRFTRAPRAGHDDDDDRRRRSTTPTSSPRGRRTRRRSSACASPPSSPRSPATAQGAVVDGSPTEVADHLDVWTFTRDVALARSQLARCGDRSGS